MDEGRDGRVVCSKEAVVGVRRRVGYVRKVNDVFLKYIYCGYSRYRYDINYNTVYIRVRVN